MNQSLALFMMGSTDVTWARPGLNPCLLAQGLARAAGEGQREEEFQVSARPAPSSGGIPRGGPFLCEDARNKSHTYVISEEGSVWTSARPPNMLLTASVIRKEIRRTEDKTLGKGTCLPCSVYFGVCSEDTLSYLAYTHRGTLHFCSQRGVGCPGSWGLLGHGSSEQSGVLPGSSMQGPPALTPPPPAGLTQLLTLCSRHLRTQRQLQGPQSMSHCPHVVSLSPPPRSLTFSCPRQT